MDGHSVQVRDWSCAQISIPAASIGHVVTIEFIVRDCTQGGHYGYAYVDNFCGRCSGPDATGNLSSNQSASTDCGRGKVCFDYTLPDNGTKKGSADIRLDLLQNGVVVDTLTSGPQASGTQYCFTLDPASNPKLSAVDGGFDFVATATFVLDQSKTLKSEGSAPDGVKSGKNNDYKISCNEGCCTTTNLFRNAGFEAGNDGSFTSAYAHDGGAYTAGAVVPGEYAVINASQAGAVSPAWLAARDCGSSRRSDTPSPA